MITPEKINRTLAEIFGFRSFRPHQEDIVRAILDRNDVFAVMPTGGGKSLCYQLPARLLDGVCVVVSPLISLMKDQVDAARSNGIAAAAFNSTSTPRERNEIRDALRDGKLDLLYISPERFNSEHFLERLKTLPISFFAIDEAHCISEWGHDFRPDYLALSRIVAEFPGVPLAAFTATATRRVADDITARLGLRSPHLTRASFNRANLFYRIVPKRGVETQLLRFVQEHPNESGIIYRTSRKKVEATAAMLCSHGFAARPYHAGMSDSDRHAAQEAFRRDECSIIVATIAFGMGIDKSNVRFVLHGDLPKNIEGYYQETGRAGRDGEPAECVLFFGRQDAIVLGKFADEIEDAEAREIAKTQLRQMIRLAENDACRRTELLRYFGEEYPEPNCGGCDICSGEVEREDATVDAQKLLSAIYRTGERFGGVHACDIVFGANTEKVRKFEHDRLPTYGVGKDKPKSYWRAVLDALLGQGILRVEPSEQEHPIPKLTEAAWAILRGRERFQMLRQHFATEPRKGKTASAPRSLADLDSFGQRLFAALRELRTEIAQAENVPAYIVFSDRSLHEMSLYHPKTEEGFLQISGVGQRKKDAYGERFLALIRRVCEENFDEATAARHPFPEKETVEQKSNLPGTSTVFETQRLLEAGADLAEIAAQRNLKPGTITSHLEILAQNGYELPFERFFTPERWEQVAGWFRAGGITEAGDWRLKPAVEASDGQLDYDEAKLARIFLFVLSETPKSNFGERL